MKSPSWWSVWMLLLLSTPLCQGGTYTYEEAWTVTGWFDQYGFASEMTMAPDGTLYLGGRTKEKRRQPETELSGGLAAKYSSNGALEWASTAYEGRGLDHVQGIGVDHHGHVYISGETYRFDGGEAFLVKFDPTGERLWERRLDSRRGAYGRELTVDSQGAAYVTGIATGLVGDTDYPGYDAFLTKYSPSGESVWTHQYDSDVGDLGKSLAVDSNDNLYLASGAGVGGAALTRMDSDGNIAWTLHPNYSTLEGRTTSINKVAVDEFGNVYTAGTTNELYTGGLGYVRSFAYAAKHSPNGDLEWRTILNNLSTRESVSGLAIDDSGSVYISGATGSPYAPNAFWSQISPTGELEYTKVFSKGYETYGSNIAVNDLGQVFVSGGFGPFQDWEAYLVRFDPTPVPEPSSCVLAAAIATSCFAGRHRLS